MAEKPPTTTRPDPAKSTPRPETIAAIATPPGRGGVGVIRVSGTALQEFALQLTGKAPPPRMATLAGFRAADGSLIDSGLLLHFPAPHSFTGEDVLELQGHGGPVVMQMLLARCLDLGARLAEPGEFTRRAFLNGKLDLAQAEAVIDLIDATTTVAARSAVRSLQGEFSREIDALLEQLIELRALVEATLDFPEEEVDFLEAADAFGRLQRLEARLAAVFDRAHQGSLLQGGLHVVLAGQPNVGKSSLLNRLAGDELAIVTPVAGTTRDVVRGNLQIEGIPLHVIDTAGLRSTDDEIEKIGIARLTVHNKIDLAGQPPARSEETSGDQTVVSLALSARTGAGIDLLRQELLHIAGWQPQENVFIARERHLRALTATRKHIAQAREQLPQLELFAEELRLAQQYLGSITGEFSADDLLGEIFGRFCIGK